MCFIGVYFITAGRAGAHSVGDTESALREDGILDMFPSKLHA